MSLVFSAITPHPPLLIENIGKEKIKNVQKTKEAFDHLEQELYLAKPNIIVVISPHGSIFEDAFSINAETEFISKYEEFGDLSTKDKWAGAPDFAAKAGHKTRVSKIPTRLISQKQIDHGVSVPLHYLTRHLPDVKIIPVGYSGLDNKTHIAFGEVLKEIIMESGKRVALVISADLSHALSDDSPAGFHADSKKFDEQIISLLETKNTVGFVEMDEEMVKNSVSCGYRSILIALGILKNMNYTFKNLCYEAPFGVGYLTGQFVF